MKTFYRGKCRTGKHWKCDFKFICTFGRMLDYCHMPMELSVDKSHWKMKWQKRNKRHNKPR